MDAVAESTKIAAPLLAALEKGDVSRWPQGIFRRAFIREYARAIGLPPGPTLSEFYEVFPEECDTVAPSPKRPTEQLRLTLADAYPVVNREIGFRALAAVLDLACVFAMGSLISYLVSVSGVATVSIWLASGMVGLLYHSVATSMLGRSGASWWLGSHSRGARQRSAAEHPELEPAQEIPPVVAARG